MVAFAANSLLCRLALGQHLIDAATFTSTRVISGALTLVLIILFRKQKSWSDGQDGYIGAATLFTYLVFFSFAYLSLSAGAGALILFGAVQLTMFIIALREGEHFPLVSWGGLALAASGLVYLVLPGLTAPNPLGAALMAIAGIAWGLYSLSGRTAVDPLAATGKNFLFAAPPVLIVNLFFISDFNVSFIGFSLAVASGALASGCGYVLWYAALANLSATRAATVQLSVPALAALGGVLLLAEPFTIRLLLASIATLGGVAIVLAQRAAKNKQR
jgi:drug/metabolite transporter (DMT)-like permease